MFAVSFHIQVLVFVSNPAFALVFRGRKCTRSGASLEKTWLPYTRVPLCSSYGRPPGTLPDGISRRLLEGSGFCMNEMFFKEGSW